MKGIHDRSGPLPSAKHVFPTERPQQRIDRLLHLFGGYTEDEMRSMLCCLGYKHPERLETRFELMRALDENTVEAH